MRTKDETSLPRADTRSNTDTHRQHITTPAGGREENQAEAIATGPNPAPQALQVCRVLGQFLQAIAQSRLSPRVANAQHDRRGRRGGCRLSALQASSSSLLLVRRGTRNGGGRQSGRDVEVVGCMGRYVVVPQVFVLRFSF